MLYAEHAHCYVIHFIVPFMDVVEEIASQLVLIDGPGPVIIVHDDKSEDLSLGSCCI